MGRVVAMERLKIVSLFAGSGGMDLGMLGDFEFLGRRYSRNPVEIVYALDNDQYACDIFNVNFETTCANRDIRRTASFEIPPHHILIGGFPCQSFSIVAQNPPRLGYKDENGRLFFEMCRIMEDRKPMCFVAENVKGILSANKGKAFPLILEAFRNASYHVTHALLEASDYGVPQKRERVFIVGFRDAEILKNFEFPKPTTKSNKVSLSEVVDPEGSVDPKYFFSDKAVAGMERVKEKMNKGRVQSLEEPCNTISAHLAKVSLNSVDPVLKINGKYRRFTPREAARIQSFPEGFVLTGSDIRQYRAIGNAVPPVLMWHVAKAAIRAIRRTSPKLLKEQPFRTREEIRSYNMSMIRSRNTRPEIVLRRTLWSRGHRYRLHCRDVYGKPDIVFRKKRVAIFLDSTFWHGKDYEKTVSRIKTNKEYWENKIKRNIERDRHVTDVLRNLGWVVLRVWDDDLRHDLNNIVQSIERQLETAVTVNSS